MNKANKSRIVSWKVAECNLFRFDIHPASVISMDKVFHDEIAIIGFKDCAWRCNQNGNTFIETPDALVFRDAGQIFSLDSEYVAPWGAICREIRFSPSTFLNLSENYQIDLAAIDFSAHMVKNPELRGLFFRAHSTLESSDCELEKSSYLAVLLQGLIYEKRAVKTVSNKFNCKPQLRMVVEYLRENFQLNIKLEDIADLVGMNPFVLLRQFRRSMGLTPHDYLQMIRVIHARKMITSGFSLGDIAPVCGFSDQSHLTRSFKRKTGVTPGQYVLM